MRVTNYEWGPRVQQEANKCWLYSILASIALSLYQLLQLVLHSPVQEKVKEKTKPGENENPSSATVAMRSSSGGTSKIYVQIVIDCCDVLIPIAALNWASLDAFIVGTAGSISSILAGQQIWRRVQSGG